MSEIRGVLPAMVTPFGEDGSLDEAGATRLARRLVENGAHGLVLFATSGESPTLSDEEKLTLLRAVRGELGDEVPLIAGTGSNDTRHSVELTKAVAEAGADAVIAVTPYYNKPSFAGLRAHYEAVAAVGLPVVLYNIPSRVVINVGPDELAELARIDNVVAVKQANDDDLGPIDGLDILAGNDNVYIRVLEFGGAGGVLVAANLVPGKMRAIWDAAQEGDLERARELDAELHDLYRALSVATNPMPIKAAMEMAGIIESERMRLPLVPVSAEERERIRAALESSGVLATAG